MIFMTTYKGNWKKFRSPEFNYDFNTKNGLTFTWGKTKDEDPWWNPYGPCLCDIEVTTACAGLSSRGPCEYCYKSNIATGRAMDFATFKKTFEIINKNDTVQQVAFGLDAAAETCPDLWKMCEYLRERNVVPNGTIAEVKPETAKLIAKYFGACAISFHGDWKLVKQQVRQLQDLGMKQVNVHFVLYKEALGEFRTAMNEWSMKFLQPNAFVLLALKHCGRAKTGPFTSVTDDEFYNVLKESMILEFPIGFDSCTANRFDRCLDRLYADGVITSEKKVEFFHSLSEPCESYLQSCYIGVDGAAYPCSFCEEVMPGIPITDFDSWWHGEQAQKHRTAVKATERSCPYYTI
jgi:MoaA/NifB/PqqE/SkfB family radical SAM enzyme